MSFRRGHSCGAGWPVSTPSRKYCCRAGHPPRARTASASPNASTGIGRPRPMPSWAPPAVRQAQREPDHLREGDGTTATITTGIRVAVGGRIRGVRAAVPFPTVTWNGTGATYGTTQLVRPALPEMSPACTCRSEPPDPSKTIVRVGRETKGRRGKGVMTVSDLPLDENGLLELAAKLRQRLGTGGTLKDGRIEIQGDHRDRIVAELEAMGYRVTRAGG